MNRFQIYEMFTLHERKIGLTRMQNGIFLIATTAGIQMKGVQLTVSNVAYNRKNLVTIINIYTEAEA